MLAYTGNEKILLKFETAFILFSLLVLFSYVFFTGKGLFVSSNYTGNDAFFSQLSPFFYDINFESLALLQYIHLVRYIITYPLVCIDLNNYPPSLSVFFLTMIALPLLKVKVVGSLGFIKGLILLLPIFISFRSFIVACAIGYLFIAIFHVKSLSLLFLSFLFSILSSGVVLVWFLIVLMNYRIFFSKYKNFSIFILILTVLAFIPSILHKQEYAENDLTSYFDYLSRGTIAVSFVEGQWSRLAFYLFCVFLFTMTSILGFFSTKSKGFYFTYSVFIVGAAFEGLGLLCGLAVLILFLSGFRVNNFRYRFHQ